MGRPRKSIAEHKANGTFRPSRHGAVRDEASESTQAGEELAEVLEKPEKLSAEAGNVWDELTELLKGSIRRRDIPALVELCRWIARSDKIAGELDALTPGDASFKGLMVAAGIATDKVSDLTKRFGISPADRMKLKTEATTVKAVKIPTRPKTKLDRMGPPKKEKGKK